MNASKNEQNLSTATAASASEPQDTITLLPPPKPIKAHLLDDAKRSDAARKAARALSERGFCVCRGGLDASIVSDARAEIAALFKHGAMTPGGFTRFGRDDLVKARRDDRTMIELSTKGDHASNPAEGEIKLLEGLTRTLLATVEENYGVKVTATSKILPWAGRHAAEGCIGGGRDRGRLVVRDRGHGGRRLDEGAGR